MAAQEFKSKRDPERKLNLDRTDAGPYIEEIGDWELDELKKVELLLPDVVTPTLIRNWTRNMPASDVKQVTVTYKNGAVEFFISSKGE